MLAHPGVHECTQGDEFDVPLVSRRKAPHMYLKIANLLAPAGGIYILVGVSRDLSESHAVWTRTDNHRSFSRVKDCAGFDTGQFVEPDVPTA
jgi:hypothetical protein